jgi:DNA-3-methyladenine glycosylase II
MAKINIDSEALHREFLKTASGLSKPLADALATAGPLPSRKLTKEPIGFFLSRTIVSQLLSVPAARSIWGRIETLGTETGTAIPDLFDSRRTTELRACGVSGTKAKALVAIAESDQAGFLDAKTLRAMDDAARQKHLCEIYGIGPWTCDMVALFFCGSTDIWPEGDVAVQRTFKRLIGRRKPSLAAAHFAPHRSTLARYMWRLVALERAGPET